MPKSNLIPLRYHRHDAERMRQRADELYAELSTRRSVRHFSSEVIPLDVVERCIATAAQAPSGANKQPWTFVLVTDPEVKRRIRMAAEREERAFYGGRAGQRWLADLAALGTGPDKPFLERAPVLIVVFAQRHGSSADERHYYVSESVGIAVGMLLTALHHVGLATLTHTPAPMRFVAEILGRPRSEQPYVIIPVGYPADDCLVPDIARKPLDEVLVRMDAAAPT
jgi:iodotyrosine deiodinase